MKVRFCRALCIVVTISVMLISSMYVVGAENCSQKEMSCCGEQESHLKTCYKNSEESKTLPLFKAYPNLFGCLPYVILGGFPTPITQLTQVGQLIQVAQPEQVDKNLEFKGRVYIKQDNLSGGVTKEGEVLFGGNKVRKLEFLLADALKSDAETILTVGVAGSNHAVATAAYSKLLGLDCILMLTPQLNTSYVKRNLLLDAYYGAEIKTYESDAQRKVAIIDVSRELILNGKKSPYFIPGGGSNEIGSIGYVNMAFELKEQIEEGLMPEPDFIYLAAGSCGTSAGLILGIKAAGLKSKVIAVRINGSHESKVKIINELIHETNVYLNSLDSNFPLFDISECVDYEVADDFAGGGYAKITNEAADAIVLLDDCENIHLDGTYTGKAFAAMLASIKKSESEGKVFLFLDTYCSGDFNSVTEGIDYKNLPNPLQWYFSSPLQDADQGC